MKSAWWQRAVDAILPLPKGVGWLERNLGGHVNVGPIVVYGANAMHWAVNIRTPWGYVCFRPGLRCFGKWWPAYFYISRDGTPNNCYFHLGKPY